jgi:hypothetical protein
VQSTKGTTAKEKKVIIKYKIFFKRDSSLEGKNWLSSEPVGETNISGADCARPEGGELGNIDLTSIEL